MVALERAWMTSSHKNNATQKIAPDDEKIWLGLECKPSTDDLAKLFVIAKKNRDIEFWKAYKAGLKDKDQPKLDFTKFSLDKFLRDPVRELSTPYPDMVINFLSLILNLEALRDPFAQQVIAGGFCESRQW